jgi:hypothetical protein
MPNENYSCDRCRFSVKALKEMAEIGGIKEMFTTFGGRKWMNIYEVNSSADFVVFRRSTGELTDKFKLPITTLMHIHDMVHSGKIELIPQEIDKVAFKWGNYVSALLRHLGCKKT